MNTGTRRTTRCHQRRQRRRPGQRAASATKPASACEQEGVYAIPRGDWLAHSADFEITVGTPEQRSISSQPTRSPRLPFKSFIIHAAHTIPAAELDLGFRSVTVRHTPHWIPPYTFPTYLGYPLRTAPFTTADTTAGLRSHILPTIHVETTSTILATSRSSQLHANFLNSISVRMSATRKL